MKSAETQHMKLTVSLPFISETQQEAVITGPIHLRNLKQEQQQYAVIDSGGDVGLACTKAKYVNTNVYQRNGETAVD